MSVSEDIHTYAGRLATFQEVHHLKKRRASSSASKRKAATAVSWPHTTPTIEDLARAGFWYKPSHDNPDNVQCYLCKRNLDGWEPGDNAAFEHLTHSPDCGWAINICIAHRAGDPDNVEVDPMSDAMVEARIATFRSSWPHEKKKGWKCKTRKMVEAGWCYDPSPEYDDGVVCCYCSLSLDGWEPKDDPWEEHRKRSPECTFFLLIEEHTGTHKSTRGKGARTSRSSRTSKASRLSVQSTFSTFSEIPSLMSIGDIPDINNIFEDSVSVDDTALTAETIDTMTHKGRKGAGKSKTAKAGKKTTRGKKNAPPSDSVLVDEPVPEGADTDLEHPMSKSPFRTTRHKNLINTSYLESASEAEEKPARKTRGKKAAARDASHLDVSSVLDVSTSQPRATRAKKPRGRPKQRTSENESQMQSELQDIAPGTPEDVSTKPKRGVKRTSEGAPKLDSSIVIPEEPPISQPSQPAKQKRGKKVKKADEKPPIPEPDETLETTGQVGKTKSKLETKATRKTRKGKTANMEPSPSPFPVELSIHDSPAPSITRQETPRQETPRHATPRQGTPRQGTPRQGTPRQGTPRQGTPRQGTPQQGTPRLATLRQATPRLATVSPAQSNFLAPPSSHRQRSPLVEIELPIHISPAASSRRQQTPRLPSEQPERSAEQTPTPQVQAVATPSRRGLSPTKEFTPSPSPQSSDAENQPPSSRPSLRLAPPSSVRCTPIRLSPRLPLADATPFVSPSKRNPNVFSGGLQTAFPWEAADLEALFLQSPLRSGSSSDDKENGDKGVLADAVQKAKAALTSPEKKMTVEEWIFSNAAKGEERLKRECEKLVGLFEAEGMRATQVLEGIETV